jgi:Secretion system C-terminal sorting domain
MQRTSPQKGTFFFLLTLLLFSMCTNIYAGDGGGSGSIALLSNTAEYDIRADILSDTGSIQYTGGEVNDTVSIPIRMYASETDADSGLTLVEFYNVIYYDTTELIFIEETSEVWETNNMSANTFHHNNDTSRIVIEGWDDTLAFGYEDWETVYYLKFKIKCFNEDGYQCGLEFRDDYVANNVEVIGNGESEQYDSLDDGYIYIKDYYISMNIDSVGILLDTNTIRVPVYIDSSNYIFYQFNNYIRYDDTSFTLVGVERSDATSDWALLRAYSDGDSIYVVGARGGGTNVGIVTEPLLLYTLLFSNEADDFDLVSDICLINEADNHFWPVGCPNLWGYIDVYSTCGKLVVDYKFTTKLKFLDEGEIGDTVTLAVMAQTNFPAGPATRSTAELSILIKYDSRFNFDELINTHDSANFLYSQIHDTLLWITADQPDGKPGYIPPTTGDNFDTLCLLELIIDDSEDYDCPDEMVIGYQSNYGMFNSLVNDTTDQLICTPSNGKMRFITDTLDIECSDIRVSPVTIKRETVIQPAYITHIFDLDSVYVELNYDNSRYCFVSYTSETGIRVDEVDANTISIHGSDLDWAAANDDWLASITWGLKAFGSMTVYVANSQAFDDLGYEQDLIERDGAVTYKPASVFPLTICLKLKKRETHSTLPTKLTLHQNHPNPFNPITRIDFDLPESDYVKLEVYNILGRKVTTLIDDYLDAGNYKVEWNTAQHHNIASGIYFYTIQAGNFVESKKMILLK